MRFTAIAIPVQLTVAGCLVSVSTVADGSSMKPVLLERAVQMNRPKIIAVDFDGCIVTNEYPDIGEPIPETITRLKREQDEGAKAILWTCRRGDELTAAAEWCTQQGIHFDAVNENLPEIIAHFGGDTRKVFANEYWDDRAVRMPAIISGDAEAFNVKESVVNLLKSATKFMPITQDEMDDLIRQADEFLRDGADHE
jgi:hypothetical protein